MAIPLVPHAPQGRVAMLQPAAQAPLSRPGRAVAAELEELRAGVSCSRAA
jgi:hypothetical protein